jgi:hypothetical protein
MSGDRWLGSGGAEVGLLGVADSLRSIGVATLAHPLDQDCDYIGGIWCSSRPCSFEY